MTWHAMWQVNVRSQAVNAGQTPSDIRSMIAVYDGDRWSMVAVNDCRWWRTIVDQLQTTVDPHQTTGQWWLTDSHRPGLDRIWARSGLGLGRVRHVACHVLATLTATSACRSHVRPRGSATLADWVPHVHVAATSAADVVQPQIIESFPIVFPSAGFVVYLVSKAVGTMSLRRLNSADVKLLSARKSPSFFSWMDSRFRLYNKAQMAPTIPGHVTNYFAVFALYSARPNMVKLTLITVDILNSVMCDDDELLLYYKIPLNSLDVGLKQVVSETDISNKNFKGYVKNHKIIDFYLELVKKTKSFSDEDRQSDSESEDANDLVDKEHLVEAVGMDANNGIYPVSYGIVESENQYSWTWFLTCLADDFDLYTNSNSTFIIERQKGLVPTIAKLFSATEHREHCDLLINNLCEVFNRQLLDARDTSIITSLEYVREYLMKRIVIVQKIIQKIDRPLTPAVTKLFNKIKEAASERTVD
nr:hypothetical protein [Tanacetum cinerariifolium]